MTISVPCRITEQGDFPILIRGSVPIFGHYTSAYQFLLDSGYAVTPGTDRELGIVHDCYSMQTAVDTFGNRLVPYSQLLGH